MFCLDKLFSPSKSLAMEPWRQLSLRFVTQEVHFHRYVLCMFRWIKTTCQRLVQDIRFWQESIKNAKTMQDIGVIDVCCVTQGMTAPNYVALHCVASAAQRFVKMIWLRRVEAWKWILLGFLYDVFLLLFLLLLLGWLTVHPSERCRRDRTRILGLTPSMGQSATPQLACLPRIMGSWTWRDQRSGRVVLPSRSSLATERPLELDYLL